MKILLDTHIWLWYLLGSDKLSEKQRQVLEAPRNDLWLSSISTWETALLIERGRLPVDTNAKSWIKSALAALQVREARLTFAIALRSRTLNLPHDDPADRFIAATAVEYELNLMTSDQRLLECREVEFA